MKLAKLFQGKDSPKEEMKEAKAIKAGKVSPKQYVRGEKMEGDKKSTKTLEKTAKDIKAGKMSPTKYARGGK
jgi:hypothetical protein